MFAVRASLAVVVCAAAFALATPLRAQDAVRRFLAVALAPPPIKAGPGFSAKLLVPPGHMSDPLYMIPHGSGAWVADDQPQDVAGSGKGGQLHDVSGDGKVSVVLGTTVAKGFVGIDLAPPGFGAYEGQMFVLGLRRAVQRVDLKSKTVFDVCELPMAPLNPNPPGFPLEGRFGPQGTPFAGKFFLVMSTNDTIYQVTPDLVCTPFITFDGKRFRYPMGFEFTPDGKTMVVTGLIPNAPASAPGQTLGRAGGIARVTPDGTMEDQLFFQGFTRPTAVARAPQGFGSYGGQYFVIDAPAQFPGTAAGAPRPSGYSPLQSPSGKVYRLAPDGEPHMVAEGLVVPYGLSFINGKLWVTDVNRDGRPEPDGFIVEIQAR